MAMAAIEKYISIILVNYVYSYHSQFLQRGIKNFAVKGGKQIYSVAKGLSNTLLLFPVQNSNHRNLLKGKS